jgi:hypothetical protein
VLYARERVSAGYRIGEYWNKEVQIDVVGVRDDDWIDLGECKWGPVGSVPSLVDELETKVRAFPNSHGDTIGRRIFTRGAAPASPPRGVKWHSLEDLYA